MTEASTGPAPVPEPRSPADDVVAGLAVSVRHRADDTVARVVGELDMATAAAFVGALDDVAAACATRTDDPVARTVWCDLADLTFVSVSGVTALEAALDAAGERGVSMHLVAGSRPVRRVLSLIGSELTVEPGGVPDPASPASTPAVPRGEVPRP